MALSLIVSCNWYCIHLIFAASNMAYWRSFILVVTQFDALYLKLFSILIGATLNGKDMLWEAYSFLL